MDKINEFAKSIGLDKAIFLKKWNGYDVYELSFNWQNPNSYYGWGVFALYKDGTVRLADNKETFMIAMS